VAWLRARSKALADEVRFWWDVAKNTVNLFRWWNPWR
jgi:hypothetical protein